jgi:S-(hydroxymethyl)glutathione dehydrogenase / alcohol dehydrogenase
VLAQQPGALQVEDLQIDEPGPGEVLVRTAAAGLCHSDLHFMEGLFRTPLPSVLGHESAGVVDRVGPGVEHVSPGDHVVCCVSMFCGQCRQCLTGYPYRCTKPEATSRPASASPRLARPDGTAVEAFSRLGGFAEQMLVHEHAVVKIRPDMPLELAALLGCGVLTGTGAVFRTADVRPGDRVCVIGVGGIGLAAVQAARIAGASQVIAVDVAEHKLDVASALGATVTVNAAEVGDPVSEVKRLSGGGVDHSFEAIGLKATSEQAYRMLDVGGTATIVGMVPSNTKIEVRGIDLLFERKLQGSQMGSNRFRLDIPHLVELYLDGRLLLDEMVSGHIGLDDVNEGYEAMKRGEVTRTVISFAS